MLVSYHRWYIEFNPYSIKTIKKYAKDEGSWIGAFFICYLFNITHFKHWLHLGATYKESGGILLRQYHLWHKTIHFILILWSVYYEVTYLDLLSVQISECSKRKMRKSCWEDLIRPLAERKRHSPSIIPVFA